MPRSQSEQAKKNARVVQAYINLFKSPDGTIVLDDLMAYCGVNKNVYKGDPNELIYTEGARSVFFRILKFSSINPTKLRERIEEYEKMVAEQDIV